MPIAAAIGVSAVVGAGASIYAANQQSRAAQTAVNTATNFSNETRADLAPYRAIGANALGDISALYGYGGAPGAPGGAAPSGSSNGLFANVVNNLPPQWNSSLTGFLGSSAYGGSVTQPGAPPPTAPAAPPAFGTGTPDYSRFTNSPDYQFARDQGLLALDRDAAARGQLLSGGHTKDVLAFANGLAAQQYGNYFNRLMAVAGLGANAAAQTGNLGASFASSIGNAQQNVGAANASGAVGVANSLSAVPANMLYAQMYNNMSRSGYAQPTPITWSPRANGLVG